MIFLKIIPRRVLHAYAYTKARMREKLGFNPPPPILHHFFESCVVNRQGLTDSAGYRETCGKRVREVSVKEPLRRRP